MGPRRGTRIRVAVEDLVRLPQIRDPFEITRPGTYRPAGALQNGLGLLVARGTRIRDRPCQDRHRRVGAPGDVEDERARGNRVGGIEAGRERGGQLDRLVDAPLELRRRSRAADEEQVDQDRDPHRDVQPAGPDAGNPRLVERLDRPLTAVVAGCRPRRQQLGARISGRLEVERRAGVLDRRGVIVPRGRLTRRGEQRVASAPDQVRVGPLELPVDLERRRQVMRDQLAVSPRSARDTIQSAAAWCRRARSGRVSCAYATSRISECANRS